MPFNFTAPNYFGKLGPSSGQPLTNVGNPIAGFERANAISGDVPNLFTTIQATQKNQQDRRVKEAAIAQALAGLVKTRMEVEQAPLDMAIKQAQANAYGTTAQYQQDKVVIDRDKNKRLLKQQEMLDRILGGGQSDGTNGTVGAVGGNLPPGSTINVGGIRVPLNQRLTDSEQAAVSGNIAIEPVVDRILTSVDTIFVEPKTTKEKIGRTARQAIADSDNTLLSSGPSTSSLSKARNKGFNSLRALVTSFKLSIDTVLACSSLMALTAFKRSFSSSLGKSTLTIGDSSFAVSSAIDSLTFSANWFMSVLLIRRSKLSTIEPSLSCSAWVLAKSFLIGSSRAIKLSTCPMV